MLRKLGTLLLLGLVLAGGAAAQSGNSGTTHVVVTNDQHFTVDNGKYLSGIYECSDGGYIDISCLLGQFPPMNCPAGQAIQSIDSSLNASCINVGAGSGPAGSDTYVQYNAFGVFGADANFTWNYGSSILTLGGGGPGAATFSGTLLASLGSPSDGTIEYCTDCTAATSPCTTGGTGSMAQRLNGAWDCFGGSGGGGTPGGNDTDIQFNNMGAFGGNDDFTWTDAFSNPSLPLQTHEVTNDATYWLLDNTQLDFRGTYGGTAAQIGTIMSLLGAVSPDTSGASNGYFAGESAIFSTTATGTGAATAAGVYNTIVGMNVNVDAHTATIPDGQAIALYANSRSAIAAGELGLGDKTTVLSATFGIYGVGNAISPSPDSIGVFGDATSAETNAIGVYGRSVGTGAATNIGLLGNADDTGGAANIAIMGILADTKPAPGHDVSLVLQGGGAVEIEAYNGATLNFSVASDGTIFSNALKTTGAATGKKVVCVDTSTGILYASSSGTDCSN